MEIEVVEYVRTIQGAIGKITSIENTTNDKNLKLCWVKYSNCFTWLSLLSIKKHSKNPIDLIEDDDIVIIEYYVKRFRERISRRFECTLFKGEDGEYVIFENKHCDWWYNKTKKEWVEAKGFNPKIKSILTKEQFKNIEYRLE